MSEPKKPLPRLEINLDCIVENIQILSKRLATFGISMTGVTKALNGSRPLVEAIARAGLTSIGDSRIQNLQSLQGVAPELERVYIKPPCPSQANDVVRLADISMNSEIQTIRLLSNAAQSAGKVHGIILMVEMGDLREGAPRHEIMNMAQQVHEDRNLELKGIATNFGCLSHIGPDNRAIAQFSELVESIEASSGVNLEIISGGNSSSLLWLFGKGKPGRINNLRIGESILLGTDPLTGKPIDGLRHDAFIIYGEVIESREKDRKSRYFSFLSSKTSIRTILSLGNLDVDPSDLKFRPSAKLLGATGDQTVVEFEQGHTLPGTEVSMVPGYGSLTRSISSPYVEKIPLSHEGHGPTQS